MAATYYKARNDDELQRIAQQQYQSYYDQLRTAAQQKADRETLALQNQRAGIQASYDKQREASDKAYRQAYSQADRQLLGRGMQRSSYGAQILANLSQQGVEANQNIWDQQRNAEGGLEAQIAQVSGQLADTLAGYDANQAADIMKRYNELQSEEYDRNRDAEQYAESIRQWQAQFDQNAQQWQAQQEQAQKQFEESIRQWQTQYDESVRQFNLLHPQDTGAAAGGGGGGGGSTTPKTNKNGLDAALGAAGAGATDADFNAFVGANPEVNANPAGATNTANRQNTGAYSRVWDEIKGRVQQYTANVGSKFRSNK